MKYKHLLLFWITIYIFLSGSVITFNYIIDPLQIFRPHTKGLNINERYQNAGIINSYLKLDSRFNAIVIGTSMSQNFDAFQIQKSLAWGKTLKLTASGSIPNTQQVFLEKALSTNHVKYILWEINNSYAIEDISIAEERSVMPKWLYRGNIFTIIQKYLYNIDTIKDSKTILLDKWDGKTINTYSNWMNEFKNSFTIYASKEYSQKRTKDLEPLQNIKIEYTYTNNFPSLNTFVLSTVKKNTDVNYIFYFPPYNKHYYAIRDNKTISRELSMRRTLVNLLSTYSNTEIYAFDTYALTLQSCNYKDDRHYSDKINSLILEMIANKKGLLNDVNIKEYEKEFITQLNQYRHSLAYSRKENN